MDSIGGQRSTDPMEGSKLKKVKFGFLILDSDSLQKSMNVYWSSFFHISMLTSLKSRKTSKFENKRTSSWKLTVFANFEALTIKI